MSYFLLRLGVGPLCQSTMSVAKMTTDSDIVGVGLSADNKGSCGTALYIISSLSQYCRSTFSWSSLKSTSSDVFVEKNCVGTSPVIRGTRVQNNVSISVKNS